MEFFIRVFQALLYVILDPELQRTIQAEIDRAIQPGQSVHYSDREKLPWTEAALLEVARIATIAPLGVPHAVSEEVALGGFVIPRGSTVFTNLYHVHHNPENFPDPETFKPERFLDETRTRIIGTENLMPFSVGNVYNYHQDTFYHYHSSKRKRKIFENLLDSNFLFSLKFSKIFQKFSKIFKNFLKCFKISKIFQKFFKMF